MPTRHPSYYCDDLVLQVEDTLFRVHRFIFQHSEVFQDMLSVPQGDGGTIEGTDDEHPLVLPSYLAYDFEQLLKVLLPQQYPPAKPTLSAQEWMSVLKLATVWNFEAVKKTAMDELVVNTQDDPILELIVAKRFDLPHWFVPAIHALARREAPLDGNDFERLKELGPPGAICKFMLKIAQVREGFHPSPVPELKCKVAGQRYCEEHEDWANFCIKAWHANQGERRQHNFIQLIAEVFECEYEQKDEEIETLMPTPSSWDFS